MKLITRDTDYAVRALRILALNKDEILTVRQLVSKTKISRPFLRKILQILSRKRIISSSKGKAGGFVLSGNPHKISIIDLIEIFQGGIKLSEHIFRKQECCNIKRCRLKKVIDEIEIYAVKRLRSVSLSYLYS